MEYYDAVRHIKNMKLDNKDKEAINILLDELDKRPSLSDIDNLKWELSVILSCYSKSRKKNKNEIYTKALQYTIKNKFGLVFYIDDFIKDVESGVFIDYDGTGYALYENGKEIERIHCDVNYLKSIKKKDAIFVAWYNR